MDLKQLITIGYLFNQLMKYLNNNNNSKQQKDLMVLNFHHSIELNKEQIVANKVVDIKERLETITKNVATDTFQKNADELLKIMPKDEDIVKLYTKGVEKMVRDLKNVKDIKPLHDIVKNGIITKANVYSEKEKKMVNKDVKLDTYMTWIHEKTILDNVSRINWENAYTKDSKVIVCNSVASTHEICGQHIGKIYNAREITDDERPQYHPNCKCYLITIQPEQDENKIKEVTKPFVRGELGKEYVEQRDDLRYHERSYWKYKDFNPEVANKHLIQCKNITNDMNLKIMKHEDFKDLENPQVSRMFLKSRIKKANQDWYYNLDK